MKNAWFIAWHDVRNQLRQGGTIVWLLVMPPIFFYFIGTVTGGFSTGLTGGTVTPVVVLAEAPGFLQQQIDLRLRDNDFAPEWRDASTIVAVEQPAPFRTLTFGDNLTDHIAAGEAVSASYDTKATSISRDFEAIRIQRSLYTALADIAAAEVTSDGALSAQALQDLNATPRIWQLETSAAGKRQKIPSGFEQTIPGILVMFTLLVLLTSGATMLVVERTQGLLRRLASAPMSRTEIVTGKWGGRMVLATVQIGVALIFGTFLFKMDWGPNLAMVILVLASWAAFCASGGLLLGSIAKTEGQASGLGVLLANLLAALGGCWWPIEITPDWMQFLQKLLPTGWTMDALHKLISFQDGPASVLPHVAILLTASLLVAMFAVSRFKYE
ncbi:MAG: ABC transporter permease [Proteobacteria bacterium]|nr:ABC transporter permease [Pseudomonadota bacterium]